MKVYMHPSQVWSFANQNIAMLREKIVVLAESPSAGRSIDMTVEDSRLEIRTCQSREDSYETVDGEIVLNEMDCRIAIMRMLTRYFGVTTSEWVEMLYADESDWALGYYVIPEYNGAEPDGQEPDAAEEDAVPPTQQELEDLVYQREDDLEMAVCDFLMAVMELRNHEAVHQVFDAEVLFEILDDLLKVLSEKHEIKVWRPTFIGDESTGADVYIEYPYEVVEEVSNE